MKKKVLCLLEYFSLIVLAIFPAQLAAAPYYEGKVVTIIVGFAAGTGYDRVSRLMAKHLPKHIPGKPAVVIQNMPGAGSMLAANYLYNTAKPDGLTMGIFNRSIVFAQLLKADGVKFDMSKFVWLCSPSTEPTFLWVRSGHPIKTIYDQIKSKKTLYIGGQGPLTFATQFVNIANHFAGLNIKIVQYASSSEALLALERKELDGSTDTYNTAKPHVDRGILRPLMRSKVLGKALAAKFEKVPVNVDLTTDPMGKSLMALHDSLTRAGRPYVAPPKTPADPARILREAFTKMLQDKELQADAEKALLELEYASGVECLKLVNSALNQPEEIVKEFGKYVKF